jgi:hypothetical protein
LEPLITREPQEVFMSEILAFQAIVIVCGTLGFVACLRFLRHFLELRQHRSLRVPADGLTVRLDRIEAVVETTALEVERIAEANRFIAKLLAERAEPGMPLNKPERVITPH